MSLIVTPKYLFYVFNCVVFRDGK